MEERQLVKRLKQRNEAAFTHLVRLHKVRIFNVCLRMMSNRAEAEDIAQDVFVRAFMSINSFRGDSALNTWLYRIAINLCKNRLKYHARRRANAHTRLEPVHDRATAKTAGSTVGEPVPRPDLILEGNQAEQRVQRALATIEASFRELLVLRDIQGLSYSEIMEITRLPEGTVKSRLHRARSALRRAFDEQEHGE